MTRSCRFRRHYASAWIALLSMLMVVLAPLVSQILAAQSLTAAASAPIHVTAAADVSGHEMHAGMSGHADSAHHQGHSQHLLEACGYCGLLAQNPTVPGPSVAVLAGPPAPCTAVVFPGVETRCRASSPYARYLSRAPPHLPSSSLYARDTVARA